ncbi:MAG: hypothetical protein JWQ34_2214 [Mucilaginibacter sp.]|jgi:uncharacterized membrane protein YozB (DUF420 family)|uniref:DUF2306 domain-containing protein n=1 Tax=Mucilaginibacter sp. TaxID=1882438 RepID=UPI002604B9CE|nr:DUF2306 domain-containing protein [Mucilaginibacter sp.]MDB5003989.1 hypothetical protein [Mucilaginibacter sp.]
MKIIERALWYFAFFWVLVLSAGTFLQYYDFRTHSVFLDLKRAAIKTGWYLPAFYCHIIGSSIILLIGYLQFSKRIYNNRLLHKILGKIYVFGVLFISAPGAYLMTVFINRGQWVTISFLLQNTLWIGFTLAAWLVIRRGNVTSHVKMMRRSYALAFGAVTLRFYIFIFTVIGNGVGFANNYIIISFLSWIPNLLLVEVINYYKNTHFDLITVD